MLRISCNSSEVVFTKPLCKFRSLSRTVQTLSIGFEVSKPLMEVLGEFKIEFKTVSNWRMIFNGPQIEYCSSMKYGNMLPFYAKQINIFKKLLANNASVDCPWKQGPYYMNFTSDEATKTTEQEQKAGVGAVLPNGKYRFTVKVYTKFDPQGFFLQWQLQMYTRLGEEVF